MIEFGGKTYIIDLNALDNHLTITTPKDVLDTESKMIYDSSKTLVQTEVITKSFTRTKEIDVIKYDLFQQLLDIVLDCPDELDTTLGHDRALKETKIGFKIAFNTLLDNKIIKEIKK